MSTSGGSQTLKKALTCSPGHVYSLATASNWGGTPDDLIDNGSYTSELSPSGDSDSVVFSSYRDGNNELYEMATNGASQTRKTTNAANDREPDYVTATYPSGTTSKEYVSLGDSVASGEGIADAWYWDSSQNGGNGAWVRGDSSPQWASSIIAGEDCHRTDSAYPSHIAFVKGWNLHPYACSGAESVNGILNKQDAWHTSEADLPQLGSNEPAYDDPNTDYDSVAPDVVTITIGANDIGFAGWIVACFIGAPGTPCGSTEDTNTLHAAMYGSTGFTADLKEVLREIKRRGEAVNPDKVPDVYLTKYYDPFPASYTQCPDTVPDGLVADGITSGEMSWLRTALSDLNEAIQDVADDSEFSGMNPRVVDLASVMDGHRWCSADPWVYGPSILNTDLLNKAVFHPTPAGQAAIRNEFLACINNSSNCD
jgi:lysophospholipase L1-like esterase